MTPTLAAFAALQALDVLTTWAGLSRGASELNPYPRALLEAGGVPELAAVKLVVGFAIVMLALALPVWTRPGVRFTFQAMNVVLAFVVLSNAGIALR